MNIDIETHYQDFKERTQGMSSFQYEHFLETRRFGRNFAKYVLKEKLDYDDAMKAAESYLMALSRDDFSALDFQIFSSSYEYHIDKHKEKVEDSSN